MLQYMKHKDHGIHIAYDPAEIKRNEENGWVCVENLNDNPFKASGHPKEVVPTALTDMTISELKEVAKSEGIIIHPAAKEKSIIKKILEAK